MLPGGLTFRLLHRCRQHLPLIGRWMFDEWGADHDSSDLEETIGWIVEIADSTQETGMVALEAGRPVGVALLRESDLPEKQAFRPWLSGVFVLPSYRRRGIASELISRIERLAARRGDPRCYLFTNNREDFYTRRGWIAFEHLERAGDLVAIMRKELG